ncbi:hypothetical protein CLOM_g22592 [Closterium sp. NIES-68]|nr:hypothetical protein CLOM_g22592 [Closterium sp. NIES-68]
MKGKKRGRVVQQQQQRLQLKSKGMKVSAKHGGGGGAAHATTLEQEMDDEFLLEQAAKRRRAPKQRRRQGEAEGEEDGVIGAGMSARILKEARKQQQEVAREMEKERGLDGAREAFDLAAAVAAREREQEEREEEAGEEGKERGERDPEAAAAAAADVERILSAARRGREGAEEGEEREEGEEEEEEDEDGEYGAFSETASMYNDAVVSWQAKSSSLPPSPLLRGRGDGGGRAGDRSLPRGRGGSPRQRTLADVIMARIQEATAGSGSAGAAAEGGGGVRGGEEEERRIPGVDDKVMEVYRGVGKLLSRFRSGKVPKAFKIVPALSNWEDVLFLTDPDNWTPAAVFAATRLFASNLNARAAQRFYRLVLLPRVRRDIRVNKKLHFALYQSLKKAVYKPAAFYKGVLLPLCQSQTCTLREAVIIGSVIQKVSIPVLHSSVALMKIAEMQYAGTNSYFMKLLLDKKYALPYRVIDAVVGHFLRFRSETRELPVIWHQCLLSLVQRYKNELTQQQKADIKFLITSRQHHHLMSPEILRELQSSTRSRGQPDAGMFPFTSDATMKPLVVTKPLEDDYRNLPEVCIGMDED